MRTLLDSVPASRRTAGRPRIIDPDADRRFRNLARVQGLDPESRFMGGYVDWEWAHARHVFDGLVAPVHGQAVLELGCHVGATAIVLAALGADVIAVDPDAGSVDLARANAARHGLEERISFFHVADPTCLPFKSGRFDWVSCNSVLEYVAPGALPGVLREIDRVLRPGGIVVVLGTSNRIWPREQHSGRWLVNYVPRSVDRITGARLRRGIGAWQIRRVLRDYDDLTSADGGRLYVAMKARMGASGRKLRALDAAARALAVVGISPSTLTPTLSLVVRKR